MSNPSTTLSLLLLISLFAKLSSSSPVFLNINCGTSDTTYSDELNMKWVGDKDYIHTGESHPTNSLVPPPFQLPQWASTLRAFPDLRKSCYTIPVPGGGKILVRARFYYGNYDNKLSPPTFALNIDANMWEVFTVPLDLPIHKEVIYVVDGDVTSVCVAQVEGGQVPFINAIEMRRLDGEMYGNVDSSRALFKEFRISSFAPPMVVRFPDDKYDRIWSPGTIIKGLNALQSDTSIMHVNITDDPPVSVLKNALSSGDVSIVIFFPFETFNTYINLYFVEMTKLRSSQKRFIQVSKFDKVTEPFSPPYQSVKEICITNTSFISIYATNDSTLPPIISAMEVFTISDPLSDGTNAKDVEALKLLQHQFNALGAWAGDPCLPMDYNWEWVQCSSDQTPRITSLDLSSMSLSGFLPDFSAMDALESIDLHNNSFSGSIPDFFGNFPNLKELNLAHNYFSGPIPSSLTNNNNIIFHFSGNQKLCQSYNCAASAEKKKKKSSGSKIGLIFAILETCMANTIHMLGLRRCPCVPRMVRPRPFRSHCINDTVSRQLNMTFVS
ncbi:Uncharacterized protein QJS10_CPB20g00830 [Acorus calamus]|uniref:Malectin-like domain-containing protein n=1 Tax=Acorus calamus TaxID=4465 RepID=A0AAV9CDL4_ACOCL|nr:Uncharacterized protein QJS10_CPB20g00830 [Acorus calamus]